MSERTERFAITGRPRLVLRLPSGDVRVVAGSPGEVVVRARASGTDAERLNIAVHGDTVTVEAERSGWGRWASVDVEIAVAVPPEIRARLASGALVLHTPAAEVDASSASGGVEAGVIEGRLSVRLASGDIRVEAAGSLEVISASGDVRVTRVDGSASLKTASGDVNLGTVAGDLTVRTASGEVVVSRFEGSRLDAKTVSGEVRVGVPSGRRYTVSLQSLSGEVRTRFPVSGEAVGAPARLQVGSVSGDISIGAAAEG